MSARRIGAWAIFSLELFLYGIFLLMVLHAFAPEEDDTIVILIIGPIFLIPAIVLSVVRTRVLKLKLGKDTAAS